MSTMEFIASLVDSLAWPVAATAVFLAFRRRLFEWLQERPQRLKAGPIELEWDKAIAQIEVDLESSGVGDVPAPTSQELVSFGLATLATDCPEAAVLEAHRRVEVRLVEMLQAAGIQPPSSGAAGLARLARERGLISAETQRAIDGVSVLRNLTAHGREAVSTAQATNYLQLVDAVLFALEQNAPQAEASGQPKG